MPENRVSITIIIPHKNTPHSLGKLLDSIGIHEDVQVIVINDHSDTLPDRLAALQEKWEDKVLFLENDISKKGAGAAQNTGLRYAAGQWLLFADADDSFCPGWYDRILPYLNLDADVIFFPPISLNSDTNLSSDRHILYTQMIDGFRFDLPTGEARLRYRWTPPWSKLIRTELVRRNQIFFDEVPYSNDVMFSAKVGLSAQKISVGNIPIYCICEHEPSITGEPEEVIFLQRVQIECERQQFLREHMPLDLYRKKAERSGAHFIRYVLKRGYSLRTLFELFRLFREYHIPLLIPDDIKDKIKKFGMMPPGRSFRGYEIKWKKAYMVPLAWQEKKHSHKSAQRKIKAKLAQAIEENDHRFRLTTGREAGKVTDCGYDSMACVYAALPADCDFVIEADIAAEHFLSGPGTTGQEAFGVFIRDTLEREPETGLYYSNMAALGGYCGRRNIFGRSGITPSDFGHAANILLYSKVSRHGGTFENDPLHYRIRPEAPQLLHLKLIRRGNTITAVMRGSCGQDLLVPEYNGGPGELAGSGSIDRTDDEYTVTCPEDMFRSRDKKHLFLGFFTAGRTEISVPKKSIRLTILNRTRKAEKKQPENTPSYPEDEFPKPIPVIKDTEAAGRVWYAAPDANADGAGSENDPLDILSAIGHCGNGETVFLLPGTYHPREDILISPDHSGKNGFRRHLQCGDTTEQKAVLDFGEEGHALRIAGDFWDITNIRVTNGLGIIIEGSYNRIRNCRTYRNLETGILIRHHLNDSPRNVWPSYNLVEDCLSFENRDPAEFNADGFACKVATGEGNCFRRCISWLNADDGFDLYTKNRKTGPVLIENCESYLNGFKMDPNGDPVKTAGNGNGFKLGGSGMYVEHQVRGCLAEGNKAAGFTSNSNPYIHLERCRGHNNRVKNFDHQYYEGSMIPSIRETIGCEFCDREFFDIKELLKKLNQLAE